MTIKELKKLLEYFPDENVEIQIEKNEKDHHGLFAGHSYTKLNEKMFRVGKTWTSEHDQTEYVLIHC